MAAEHVHLCPQPVSGFLTSRLLALLWAQTDRSSAMGERSRGLETLPLVPLGGSLIHLADLMAEPPATPGGAPYSGKDRRAARTFHIVQMGEATFSFLRA